MLKYIASGLEGGHDPSQSQGQGAARGQGVPKGRGAQRGPPGGAGANAPDQTAGGE